MPDLAQSIERARQRFLDTLFPPVCAGCGAANALLCEACRARIRPVVRPACRHCLGQLDEWGVCHVCQAQPNHLTALRAVGVFEEPLRGIIHRFKYEGQHALAAPLADLIVQALGTPSRAVIVTPAPSHPRRLGERGYDHAGLLAEGVARRLRAAYQPDVLARVRPTEHQVRLKDPAARRANVAGAFHARPLPTDAIVVLVDDVYTTGATMTACAEALRAAGAAEVWGAVVARAR